MSALGQKRTFAAQKAMSAKCQKRTLAEPLTNSRYWPPEGVTGFVVEPRLGNYARNFSASIYCCDNPFEGLCLADVGRP